jgi:hypothetical protein
MVAEITIDEALKMKDALLVDVRSEGEYSEDTIPGAVNIPVLDNKERALVGTLYRCDGPVSAGGMPWSWWPQTSFKNSRGGQCRRGRPGGLLLARWRA